MRYATAQGTLAYISAREDGGSAKMFRDRRVTARERTSKSDPPLIIHGAPPYSKHYLVRLTEAERRRIRARRGGVPRVRTSFVVDGKRLFAYPLTGTLWGLMSSAKDRVYRTFLGAFDERLHTGVRAFGTYARGLLAERIEGHYEPHRRRAEAEGRPYQVPPATQKVTNFVVYSAYGQPLAAIDFVRVEYGGKVSYTIEQFGMLPVLRGVHLEGGHLMEKEPQYDLADQSSAPKKRARAASGKSKASKKGAGASAASAPEMVPARAFIGRRALREFIRTIESVYHPEGAARDIEVTVEHFFESSARKTYLRMGFVEDGEGLKYDPRVDLERDKTQHLEWTDADERKASLMALQSFVEERTRALGQRDVDGNPPKFEASEEGVRRARAQALEELYAAYAHADAAEFNLQSLLNDGEYAERILAPDVLDTMRRAADASSGTGAAASSSKR